MRMYEITQREDNRGTNFYTINMSILSTDRCLCRYECGSTNERYNKCLSAIAIIYYKYICSLN